MTAKLLTYLGCALLIFGLATSLATGSPSLSVAEQEGLVPQDQELAKRVADLERELASSREALAAVEKRVANMDAWFKRLPVACKALNGKMDEARKSGFEFAGPNPKAKAAVLDGLKSFAAALEKPPGAKATGKPRRTRKYGRNRGK
ncbi:MAG: hypothetical protein V3W41_10480 [Planctomycetota bacterium]